MKLVKILFYALLGVYFIDGAQFQLHQFLIGACALALCLGQWIDLQNDMINKKES